MLITKFNKMIRNKFLWGAFAGIISLALAVTMAGPRGGCSPDQEQRRDTEGLLFGKEISRNAFAQAKFYEIGNDPSRSFDVESERLLRKRTWRRIAALEKAESLGISVSDEEISNVIQNDPSFRDQNGAFSPERYRALLYSAYRMKNAEEYFETRLRQDMTIQKMVQLLGGFVWTSPFDSRRRLCSLVDSFIVQYAVIDFDKTTKKVKVSNSEVTEYFDNNKEMFTVPESINVSYVEFPFNNYKVEKEFSVEDLQDYYYSNMEDFTEMDTNDISVTMLFDDVKDDISELLTKKAIKTQAVDDAVKLVEKLVPDRYASAISFEDATKSAGLTVNVTEFFTAGQELDSLAVGVDFVDIAFSLDADDKERYFSDVIDGEESVFVIAANEKKEARIPDFKEVRADVKPVALEAKKTESFSSKSMEIVETIDKDVAEGKTFKAAAKKHGLKAITTEAISLYGESSTNEIEYAETLAATVAALNEGEVSELIKLEEESLVAYLSKREPGDAISMQLLRPQLIGVMEQYNASVLYDEWLDYILAESGFVDNNPVKDRSLDIEDEDASVE